MNSQLTPISDTDLTKTAAMRTFSALGQVTPVDVIFRTRGLKISATNSPLNP